MTDARAITVKQPWAWAIAHGGKTIENRSRGTKFRGTILIHAGASWSDRGGTDRRVLAAWSRADGLRPVDSSGTLRADQFVPGGIVAVAQLVDSHPDAGCCQPWGETTYTEGNGRRRTDVHHLVLDDVRPLAEPIPARGALGLWRPPLDVVHMATRPCTEYSHGPDGWHCPRLGLHTAHHNADGTATWTTPTRTLEPR